MKTIENMKNTVEIHAEFKSSDRIECGQYYIDVGTQKVYILHNTERNGKVVLVNLLTGNAWSPPCTVQDLYDISVSEFKEITNGDKDIQRLTTPFTITPSK